MEFSFLFLADSGKYIANRKKIVYNNIDELLIRGRNI